MSRFRVVLFAAVASLAAPIQAAPAAPGAVPPPPGQAPARPLLSALESTEAHPQPLPLGGSVHARLPKGAAAVYHFEATEPGVLKVAVGGPVDLVLTVATPEGLQAAAGRSDDDEHGDWSESVQVPLFTPGTYRIVIGDYDEKGDSPFFLAASFVPGEPEPDDELHEDDIKLMRGFVSPSSIRPGKDVIGELRAGRTSLFRVIAPPGVYVVSSASQADLTLNASSGGPSGAGGLTPWSFPTLEAWGPLSSERDLQGEPGREAVVLAVGENGPAWLSVDAFLDEGVFTLRMEPVSIPQAPPATR